MSAPVELELNNRLKINMQLTEDLDIYVNVKAANGCQLSLDKSYLLIRIGVFNDTYNLALRYQALGYKTGTSLYSLKDDMGELFLVLPITCNATGAVHLIAEYDAESNLERKAQEDNDVLKVDVELTTQVIEKL